jgi:hypothetical protein
VGLLEVRDPGSAPAERIERRANEEVVALQERDLMSISTERKRRGQAGDAAAQHRDREARRARHGIDQATRRL